MVMQANALASVYARSLFELAEQAGGHDKIAEVGDELEQICELMRADRMFRELLASPIIDREKRGEALNRIFSNRITDMTLRFLLLLNNRGRLAVLESINDSFIGVMQEAFGRVEVNVYTPAPLGDEQRDVIRGRIQSAIGKEPILHQYTEPDMLGGIKLRIGDQLIDGSISTRLKRMRSDLLTNGPAAMRERIAEIIDDAAGETGA